MQFPCRVGDIYFLQIRVGRMNADSAENFMLTFCHVNRALGWLHTCCIDAVCNEGFQVIAGVDRKGMDGKSKGKNLLLFVFLNPLLVLASKSTCAKPP